MRSVYLRQLFFYSKMNEQKLKEILNAAFFQRDKVEIQAPLITIQDKIIAHPESIICIAGLPKARKTTWLFNFIAAATTGKEYFNIKAEKGKVILIDTEQSKQDHLKAIERAEKLINKEFNKQLFTSFCFRKYSLDEILQCIVPIMNKFKPKYLILDALTELVLNLNDMEESKKLVEFLKFISSEYNCVIIGIMHLAKSSNFTAGALGSAIDRVCQSLLTVTKDETGASILSAKYLRSDEHFKDIAINYDSEAKTLIEVEHTPSEKVQKWSDKTKVEHWNICETIYENQKSFVYSAVIDNLKSMYGRGETITRREILPYLISQKFIVNTGNGYVKGKFTK